MKIKSSPKIQLKNLVTNKAWKALLYIGLLILFFFLGYISQSDWNFNKTWGNIKKSLIKTDQMIVEELRQEMGLYHANGLATIFLDIPFDSLLSIEEKRTEALISEILLTSDDDFVPARLRLNNGDPINIKIRLKGDWTDHLVGDKWSFRIHIEDDDQAILGMKRFSIQAPETRNYEKEWIFHQNLIEEEILTTRYYFVNVVQNGKYNGIYALEESFTEDLLESQGRREGVIIRFNEDLLWKNWENLGMADSEIEKLARQIGLFWMTDVDTSEITAFRANHISRDILLESELITAVELLHSFNEGLVAGDEVFDQECWGKYFALVDLWGAGHATSWINLRFYYNPITGLLEPVVFDALPFEPSAVKETLAFPFGSQGFIQKIFALPGVQKEYTKHLERISAVPYINQLEGTYKDELNHFHQVLSGYFEQGLIGDIPPLPWDDLKQRAMLLQKNLQPPQPVQGNISVVDIDGADYMNVELSNLMVLAVEIDGITIGEKTHKELMNWCSKIACQKNVVDSETSLIMKADSKITLQIPFDDLDLTILPADQITLQAHLYGGSYSSINPLDTNYVPLGVNLGVKPQVNLDFALDSHPFLTQLPSGDLSIQSGNWHVEGDLILPKGTNLLIPAGTSLSFEPGAILLVHGKLDLLGSEAEPVLLSAREDYWGGVVVLNSGPQESKWTYGVVEDTASIERSGWILTGGITFYNSPVDLSHVDIGVSIAEDAINIIQSEFSFSGVKIYQTQSDAFDGDFAKGTIEDCYFTDIGGDALDFSGSVIQIDRSEFSGIGDKAVSAGEQTILSINNSKIENTNIGIASKDLSEVSVNTLLIDEARFAALAAYIKKPQFGPALLNSDQVEIQNTERSALCQIDSILILNGDVIPGEEIDVETLYEQGFLGN